MKETVWEETCFVCVCVCVCVCVRACVCLAKRRRALEPLAVASDSVSSSPFIRSASRHCHLSFPRAYITHAFAGPLTIGSCASTLVCWLVFVLSQRAERGRPGQLLHLGSDLNVQTGWMSNIDTFGFWVFFSCHTPRFRDLFPWKMSWDNGSKIG